ncbi:MAG: hypothetical protein Q4B72_04380 [Lachnospiraceae bacterium]|nr:hypothetical protein [Lachnospiraceae bacterium]
MKKRQYGVKKGQFGYINCQKRFTCIRTASYFGLSLLLYLIGLWSTGSNANLLTVVAVLGCLPASKSLVNAIMFLKAKECSGTLHEQIEKVIGDMDGAYDMFLTSYEANYPLSHVVIRGGNVCGITESAQCDPEKAQKHLETWFRQNSFTRLNYKIFTEEKKYIERLIQLQRLEKNDEEATQLALIRNLSL